MIRALMTAASGMKAQQMQVDTIANNIANANTPAFKKSELSFRALFYQTYREPGAPTSATQRAPTGLQVGSGTEIAGSSSIQAQGDLQPFEGDVQIAIQGEGFFKLRTPAGDFRYTRDGSFHRDGTGTIVSNEGLILDGAPTIATDAIHVIVGDDGTLSTQNTEGGTLSNAGQIQLWRFPNPAGLMATGNNLFLETPTSGTAQVGTPGQTGTGVMKQNYREGSNVQVVDELVALIVAQRSYEVNSRAIKASDEMLQQVNNMVR
ncbi:MAG: flagellar basal-body rod protein FlgG [Planctomycetes bacterium]|nr:flagellar basal-body rod protein FlgG [Planctomycetota bacterium]